MKKTVWKTYLPDYFRIKKWSAWLLRTNPGRCLRGEQRNNLWDSRESDLVFQWWVYKRERTKLAKYKGKCYTTACQKQIENLNESYEWGSVLLRSRLTHGLHPCSYMFTLEDLGRTKLFFQKTKFFHKQKASLTLADSRQNPDVASEKWPRIAMPFYKSRKSKKWNNCERFM